MDAVHDRVTCASPAEAFTFVGAARTRVGVALADDEAVELVADATALTV